MTSCSSAPEAYNRVAVVTLKEWFSIPADVHRLLTVWASLFRPFGWFEYQQDDVGLLDGFR